MKMFLSIKVYSIEDKIGLTYEKVFKSMFVPKIGEKIKDSLFVELKDVIDRYDYIIYKYSIIIKKMDIDYNPNKLILNFILFA